MNSKLNFLAMSGLILFFGTVANAAEKLNGETRDAGGIGWGANIGYRF
ncbi:hypothetical protein P7F88_02170 [Vibrio hannami]|nr:hypothetical protein [Vibrio hannami]MDG3084957.1 hypothetical protein [Vibrio hannami]